MPFLHDTCQMLDMLLICERAFVVAIVPTFRYAEVGIPIGHFMTASGLNW